MWLHNALSMDSIKPLLAPLNHKYAREHKYQNRPIYFSDEIHAKEYKGAVLLLGGDYGETDSYTTATGKLSGAQVHLAAFYSTYNPIKEVSDWIPFLSEIILGAILGCLSHTIIAKGQRGKNILLHLFALVFITSLTFFLLIWRDIWLNPAPLVLGMYLHSLISHDSKSIFTIFIKFLITLFFLCIALVLLIND